MEKRILFKKGYQKRLLNQINRCITIGEMARFSHCSERTIRDWRKEKFLAKEYSIKMLCKKAKILFPRDRVIEMKSPYWYSKDGSIKGGLAVLQKYGRIGGDPAYRKRKWREWWEREGRYRPGSITEAKQIRIPLKSKELAEFVGIILGDGSITKNQIVITLHRNTDRKYGKFVITLIKGLFRVPVGIYKSKCFLADDYVISRTRLVRYCVERLGLKIGNKVKQQVDMPTWIKENKALSISALRGLVDTDGCVFDHKYKVNGKKYVYKKITFSNSSLPLIDFVHSTLGLCGILSRRARQGKEIRIDSINDVGLFFKQIGSHNPKHLKRFIA